MIRLLKAAVNGFYDGWNGTEKYRSIYFPDTVENDDNINHDIIEEIAALEIIIERRKAAAAIIEKQLENTFDNNKRVTLLTKLNTMDKQTLKDVQRLNKLKAMV